MQVPADISLYNIWTLTNQIFADNLEGFRFKKKNLFYLNLLRILKKLQESAQIFL